MVQALLAEALLAEYDVRLISVHALAHGGGKPVYRVTCNDGTQWIVRALPPDANDYLRSSLANAAIILAYLARQHYPAERILSTTNGHSTAAHDGWQLLVTSNLGVPLQTWPGNKDGAEAHAEPPVGLCDYHRLGATLGRLHALPMDGTPLPDAINLPRRDLVWVAGQLASWEGRVPAALRSEYSHLVAVVDGTDFCEGLPQVLLHSDCHPWNAVRTQTDEIVLVDWDGAGIGPTVIDVGQLIGKCHLGKGRPNEEVIQALVSGYSRYRRLTAAEIARLPDACRTVHWCCWAAISHNASTAR